MNEAEIILRSAAYTITALLIIAGAVHYGWELRERLAQKIEYFGITQKRWRDYDQQLKRGELQPKAQLHDIRERQSEK
jgi:hypothetical protein